MLQVPMIKPTWQKNEKLNPVIVAISTLFRGKSELKQIRSTLPTFCFSLENNY